MRKLIAMLCLVAVITGCEKNEEKVFNTLNVTVSYTYSSNPGFGNKLSDDAFVYLFRDTGKEVDNDRSYISTLFNPVLTYKDFGRSEEALFTSQRSEVTFKNVPNGNYILWVGHNPSNDSEYKMSSTKLTLTGNDDIITKNVVLDMDKTGYQTWQEK